MATTPGRILTDPLFRKVPYDLLIVDDAPRIPTPLLLAASGLIRERIILSGNTNDLLPRRIGILNPLATCVAGDPAQFPRSACQRGIIFLKCHGGRVSRKIAEQAWISTPRFSACAAEALQRVNGGTSFGNDFTYNVLIPFLTIYELPNTLTAFR